MVENRLWCLCHHHGGGGASTLLWNGSRQLQGHRQTPTTCNGRRRRWLSSWKTQKEVQPLEDYSSTAANIPEDLRLPTFADPIGRLLAGLVDFGVACGVGLGSGWLVSALTTVPDLGSWTALTAGTFAWITRDALFEEGNRSLGKILYDIEIAYWDGQLASRIDSVKRNMHYLFVPFVGVHEYVGHALLFCIVWDIATHMVTYDARKLGDYFAGTYVVASPPGRETRVLDMIEQAELEEVEKEIGGFLSNFKQLGHDFVCNPLVCFLVIQKMLVKIHTLPFRHSNRLMMETCLNCSSCRIKKSRMAFSSLMTKGFCGLTHRMKRERKKEFKPIKILPICTTSERRTKLPRRVEQPRHLHVV